MKAMIKSSRHGIRTPVSIALVWGDPFAFKNTSDGEIRIKNRDNRDPDQGPAPEPGDSNIVIASIVGIIVGGILGVIIGVNIAGSASIFIGLITGCIIGGLIGVYIGSLLKNRKRTPGSGLPPNKEEGPFVK